ncbi:MAG: hypothetical protein IJU39_06220 [Clostridia bacterium]|nr:hypothetical protein [Clostridia bacterium]
MNFSGLLMDENLKNQIENCFSSGRIPHAFIIEGAKEEERRALADFLAKAFVCKSDEKPCRTCTACRKIDSKSHLDYKIFEGRGKTGAVAIDDVRELRSDVFIAPNEADRKVYLVCNAHKMNDYAQNALLKVLEEPPEYAVIILECEERSQLLETVRSRCASFRVGEVKNAEVSQKKLEQSREISEKIAKSIVSPTEAELMALLGSFEKDREMLRLCISSLVEILRDAAVCSQGAGENHDEAAKILCESLDVSRIIKMISTLNGINEDIDKNANNSLLLSRMCYLLRRDAGR